MDYLYGEKIYSVEYIQCYDGRRVIVGVEGGTYQFTEKEWRDLISSHASSFSVSTSLSPSFHSDSNNKPKKSFCSYCHGTTKDDDYGNCCACGAPRLGISPFMSEDEEYDYLQPTGSSYKLDELELSQSIAKANMSGINKLLNWRK